MLKIMKTTILVILGLKMLSCCDCNLEEMINDTVPKNSSVEVGKRQLNDDDDDAAEVLVEPETTEEITTTHHETTKLIKETDTPIKTESIDEDEMRKTCRHYKYARGLELSKMVDVWKIVYYKASEKVACFKIYIKDITAESRKELQKKYGIFKNAVSWNECHFEIVASPNGMTDPRHFLQGAKDKDVFENILVMRYSEEDPPFLMEQSPNQWTLLKNLLLMRDCESGDVVVFTRVPFEPSTRELEDALSVFGESMNGTMACQDKKKDAKYKYETLS